MQSPCVLRLEYASGFNYLLVKSDDDAMRQALDQVNAISFAFGINKGGINVRGSISARTEFGPIHYVGLIYALAGGEGDPPIPDETIKACRAKGVIYAVKVRANCWRALENSAHVYHPDSLLLLHRPRANATILQFRPRPAAPGL